MPEHRHEHGHDHDHDRHGGSHSSHAHDHAEGQSARVLAWAFALTALFMLVEAIGGVLAHSLAVVADAGHMLTDAASLALAWSATHLARRPADRKRSFGYQRLRVIATFVNGCALLFIVVWIVAEAVGRLLHPVEVNAKAMLLLGAIGLAVNIIVFTMLRREGDHDMNVAAATLHVIGDLLGSVAAIAAAAVILWTGWLRIDPLLSMLVSALVVRSAIVLVRRSAHILMEGTPDWLDVVELRRTLEEHIPAVRDVHHVHAWQVGPHETLLTMHASVVEGANHAVVLREAQHVLSDRYGITHATIQIETEPCGDECGPGEESRTQHKEHKEHKEL
ncbi:MAG TPA: cation diffusion facilitator family transporter [Steroidobacteraceae bacterium]|nr:cation diffusion facilitator family transporter [Steroidobacteraceae bacterium]